MSSKGYRLLGWVVWQLGLRHARRKLSRNRHKAGAAAVVALVLVGGLIAARSGGD